MGLIEWADAAINSLINYQCSVPLYDKDDWQSWGMLFFNDPYLATLDPPNPYDFTDWQEWARRLADALGPALGAPPQPSGPGPFSKLRFIITQDNRPIITQSGNFLVTQ